MESGLIALSLDRILFPSKGKTGICAGRDPVAMIILSVSELPVLSIIKIALPLLFPTGELISVLRFQPPIVLLLRIR